MARLTSTTRKFALAGTILAGTLTAMALPGAAHASPPFSQAKGAGCHAEKVILNGSNPPSITCLDATGGSTNGVSPDTNQNCSSGYLFIYDQPNGNGNSACFGGGGYTDLTLVPYPGIGQHWNDHAVSYNAGAQGGRFYVNTGETGTHWDFNPQNQIYNFNPQFSGQASSICISPGGPTGCP